MHGQWVKVWLIFRTWKTLSTPTSLHSCKRAILLTRFPWTKLTAKWDNNKWELVASYLELCLINKPVCQLVTNNNSRWCSWLTSKIQWTLNKSLLCRMWMFQECNNNKQHSHNQLQDLVSSPNPQTLTKMYLNDLRPILFDFK